MLWVRSFSTRLPSVIFAEEKVLIFTALHGMQRGLNDEISVRLSNAWIVTKRKKAMFRFLYHMKDHLS